MSLKVIYNVLNTTVTLYARQSAQERGKNVEECGEDKKKTFIKNELVNNNNNNINEQQKMFA